MSNNILSVGQVADRCDIKISTIHFYERKGLISSWRNSGNQRRYSRDVLRRISIIKAAQKVGISLEEIRLGFHSWILKRYVLNEFKAIEISRIDYCQFLTIVQKNRSS